MGEFDGLLPDIVEKDKKEDKQIENWVATAAMILGFVFIALVTFGVLLVYPAEHVTVERTSEVIQEPYEESFVKTEELPILFDAYLGNSSEYDTQELVVLGFLQKRDLDRGLVEYSILDDYSKRIEVRGLSDTEKALFPLSPTKTRDPYELTGKFDLYFTQLRFQAQRVLITTRPVNETLYTVTLSRNSTLEHVAYHVKRESLLRHLLRQIGTPSETCEDGTPLVRCAPQQPYYCDENALLKRDADRCGLPTAKNNTEDAS